MGGDDPRTAFDVAVGEGNPPRFVEYVSLHALVLRPQAAFALPWEELRDGTVRFRDCRDRTRADRWMRRGFLAIVWCFSLVWCGLAAGIAWGGGAPIDLLVILAVLGAAFAAVGIWIGRGGRCRVIDVDLHGRVRISQPGCDPEARGHGAWEPARLQISPFHEYIERRRLEGFALVLRDHAPRAALFAAPTVRACIDALEAMPTQVATLPVVEVADEWLADDEDCC